VKRFRPGFSIKPQKELTTVGNLIIKFIFLAAAKIYGEFIDWNLFLCLVIHEECFKPRDLLDCLT